MFDLWRAVLTLLQGGRVWCELNKPQVKPKHCHGGQTLFHPIPELAHGSSETGDKHGATGTLIKAFSLCLEAFSEATDTEFLISSFEQSSLEMCIHMGYASTISYTVF